MSNEPTLISDEPSPTPDKPKTDWRPLLQWLGVTIAMSFVAVGAGGLFGLQIVGQVRESVANAGKAEAAVGSKYAADTGLANLPPIVTNLADPPDAWVRLQAAIVFDTKAVPAPDVLAAQISEDFLGFLKTLTVGQIGGASGLQHLREDLGERASIRSEGRVRELIIETLVVQ
ncbi:MAG: flagellar basal body-associated FliL family protein [Beijerinckiaceae bacterium]